MAAYFYAGNDTVGAHVRRILDAAGWFAEDIVEDAEVVITYFTSTTALEDAYFGTDGIVKRAASRALLIDLSPTTPTFARELSAVAMVNDLRPVEAPIVVLDTAVQDAFADIENIACFVAGEKADIDDATAVLELLAGNAQITGAAGSAQMARAALSVQVAAQIVAAIEADALFRAVQNDPASEVELEGRAGAASPHADQVLSAVAEKRFSGTYTVEMFIGELAAAMGTADDIDLVLPQLEACMRVLELLAVIGGVDMAPSALALLYREEEEVREAGLDWSRAAEYYSTDAHLDDEDEEFYEDNYDASYDFDDYDDYADHDHECGCGHDHDHGHDGDHECGCGHDHGHSHQHGCC